MKNKQKIAKRREQAKQRKQEKRKVKHVGQSVLPAKNTGQDLLPTKNVGPNLLSDMNIMHRPPLAEMGAPDGFRSIGMAQAMMVYAEPIMNMAANEAAFNEAIQIGMHLWNYALGVEKGNADKKIESGIVANLSRIFQLDAQKAKQLFETMVARRSYLFPPEIQPKNPMFMFVRKEQRIDIVPFGYSKVALAEDIVPADDEDRDLIAQIKTLENMTPEDAKYEKLFFTVKDECQDRFAIWLEKKGVKEDVDFLASRLGAYLEFVYFYMHDTPYTLSSIPRSELEEFFQDYLLRKVLVPPTEYVAWPASIKLFYRFLKETAYLEDAEKIIKVIDSLEPHFLKVLRKQFS